MADIQEVGVAKLLAGEPVRKADRLESRLAVVGRNRSNLTLTTPSNELDAPVPIDPIYHPACDGPFPVCCLEEFELQRRATAVDGWDSHRINPKQSVTICNLSPGENTPG